MGLDEAAEYVARWSLRHARPRRSTRSTSSPTRPGAPTRSPTRRTGPLPRLHRRRSGAVAHAAHRARCASATCSRRLGRALNSSYRWAVLAAGTFAQATYSAIWFGVAVMAPALARRSTTSRSPRPGSCSAPRSAARSSPWSRGGWPPTGSASGSSSSPASVSAGWRSSPRRACRDSGRCSAACSLAGMSRRERAVRERARGDGVVRARPQRGLALGIRQTAIPIGGFVVSLVLPPLVRHDGVAAGFAALGVACLAATVVGRPRAARRPARATLRAPDAGRSPFRDRRVWSMAFGSALIVAPQMCLVGFTVVFLHEQPRADAQAPRPPCSPTIQLLGDRRPDRRRPLVGRRREPHRAAAADRARSPRSLVAAHGDRRRRAARRADPGARRRRDAGR